MFKAIISSVGALVVASAAASAADLPSRRAPLTYAPPPVVPVFTWTGAYIGGNIGGGFTARDTGVTAADDNVSAAQFRVGTVPQTYTLHQSGVTAGGQIGYNLQLGSGVFGGLGGGSLGGGGLVISVEADVAYTDLNTSQIYVGNYLVTSQYRQGLDYLGTVRGRLGYAFDRLLVFGTGGFAYGRSHFSHQILAGNDNNAVIWSGNQGSMQTGYAFGGGVEYAVPTTSFPGFTAGAVTVRAEYLRYDLGVRSVQLVGGLGAPYSFTDRYRTAGNIVRGAVNYKFDLAGAPVPVVARY